MSNGKPLEVAERGVARAEVVERQAHAYLLELVGRTPTGPLFLDEDRLGQLERQARGRHSALDQCSADDSRQILLHQLARRQLTATAISGSSVVSVRQASWITHSPIGRIRRCPRRPG